MSHGRQLAQILTPLGAERPCSRKCEMPRRRLQPSRGRPTVKGSTHDNYHRTVCRRRRVSVALTKTNIGTHPDTGRPLYHYAQVDSDKPVVIVGPHISGTVTLPDGTVYDVTDDVIEVEPGHAGAVSHAIGLRHEAEGHPLHAPTAADPYPEPFRHVCTDHCGDV